MDATQMLKGVLPLTVLSVLDAGDGYGYEVLNRLRTAGLVTVGDASVYGTLQRLYDAGLLASYLAPSDAGPSRRYYCLTASGAASLKEGREGWVPFRDAVDRLLESSGLSR